MEIIRFPLKQFLQGLKIIINIWHSELVLSHCSFNCISLMSNDVKHRCMCLLAIPISFLIMCPFKSFAIFFTRLFVLSLNYKKLFHCLDSGPLSDIMYFVNIFPRLRLSFLFTWSCLFKNKGS